MTGFLVYPATLPDVQNSTVYYTDTLIPVQSMYCKHGGKVFYMQVKW